ncbi:MAG TPA: MFS transporter [Roseiflexaceae bacterium]|nr:MFS transporter [Roseiflexaceae bacterium]
MGTFFPVVLRFKLFFALLLAAVGVFFSYLALYLKTVGLSGSQIGIILGMFPLISFLVQPLWGMVSDIYRLRRSALACACFGVALPAWLYNARNDFWWLFGLTLALAVMNGPIGPLGDALALEYLEHQSRRKDYGSLRLWGSLGFAVSTFLIGALLAETAIRFIIPIYSLMMAALGLLALTLPGAAPTRIIGWLEGAALLQRAPQLAKFLISMLLIGATLGVADQYLVIYLSDIHASGWITGMVFALAALVEALLMGWAAALIQRWGLRQVLIAGIAVLPLRWVLYTIIREPILVIPIQMLHSIAMLSLLVAGVLYVDQQLSREWRGTGQALYQAMLHGAGSSFGLFVAGFVYQYGGIVPLWWTSTIVGVAGLLLVGWATRAPALSRVEEGART